MMTLTTLANGLRVASRPMQSVETVAVGLYVDTGSRHEPSALNGLAHLFEHMVFKGAGGRSAREISELVENVGGELNASTDRELTAFYASLLAPDLPLGVALLSDLVCRPHFEPSHLELERKVVLQELAEVNDTPSDVVFDHLQEVAFARQPLGRSVLGSKRSIGAIGTEHLQQWRDRHYVANRLLLVAAGKLDHAQLVDLAEKHLGGIRSGPCDVPQDGRFTGGEHVRKRRAQQAHVAIAMPAPAWGAPDAYASQVFADVVGAGSSSRLFQQLREDQGLAYSVAAGAQHFSDCGLFWTYAATSPGDAAWARSEIERVLAGAVDELTQVEVDRARALAKAAMMMSLESCWGQASYVASRLLREGKLTEPAEIVARMDAVTLEQVREAGRAMLSGPRAVAAIGTDLQPMAA